MSVLSKPYFHDEQAAFTFVEGIIWPQGPICAHCGCTDRITAVTPNPEKRVRFGLKRCGDCKGQFTVRMGTIFEESKLPMTKWLQAIYLMCASKKGVSSLQLSRVLEITYKTAWFLSHRIRLAMESGDLAPFGMGGGIVEVDETFIGNDPDAPAPKKGLHRYLAEFDFRYSNRIALGVDDQARTGNAIRGVVGKRLTYRRTGGLAAGAQA